MFRAAFFVLFRAELPKIGDIYEDNIVTAVYTGFEEEIYTKEIGYEPSFYEVLVSGGTRKLV